MLAKEKKEGVISSAQKLIAKSNPKSPVVEQYKTIRTNIQFASIDRELHSIMVTSTGPGEGKSTTAGNLAVVFAQQGKKVLLVDTDLRKPTVHKTFGIPNTEGLSNVLTKRIDLAEAIIATDEANLFILPSGPIPPNPAELLMSKAMRSFQNQIQQLFELVIFDTPPLLAVTDAQVMAHQCDGTILVVSSENTKKEQAEKAVELLKIANANVLGVVLNNAKVSKSHNHYYYYDYK